MKISRIISSFLLLPVLAHAVPPVLEPTDPRDFCWGERGRVSLDWFAAEGEMQRIARAIAVVPSGPQEGKIYLVGSVGPQTGAALDLLVVRLNPDGSIDTSFGSGGYVRHDDNLVLHSVYWAEFDSENRLVIAASAGNGVNAKFVRVTRLNLDGSRDLSFGSAGVYTDTFGQAQSVLRGASLQSDDKILLSGYVEDAGNANDRLLMARLSAGGVRETFSLDNRDSVDFNVQVPALQQISDGNYAALKVQQGITPRISRRNSAMAETASFAVPTAPDHTITWAYDLMTQADGSFLVLVRGSAPGISDGTYLIRLTSEGELDSSFDGDGVSQVADLAPGNSDSPYRTYIDSKGRIYVSYGANSLVRWTASGALDRTFGDNGFFTLPKIDAQSGYGPHGVVFDGNGALYGIGTDRNSDGKDKYFAYKLWEDPEEITQSFCDDVVGLRQDGLVRPGTSGAVLQFEVVVSGDLDPLVLTGAALAATGTQDISKIVRARLFFGGANRSYQEAASVGTKEVSGEAIEFSNLHIPLEHGINNFWLVYQLAADTPVDHVFDAELVSVSVGGITAAPSVSSPEGNIRAANVIAQWSLKEFDPATQTEVSGTSFVAGVTANPLVAGPGVDLQTDPYYGKGAFLITNWPTSTAGMSDYLEVSLTVDEGTFITYESLVYSLVVDSWYHAPDQAILAGSIDGFELSNVQMRYHALTDLMDEDYQFHRPTTFTTSIAAMGTISESTSFRWFPFGDAGGYADSSTIFGLANISDDPNGIYQGTGSDVYVLGTIVSPDASVSAIVRSMPDIGAVSDGPVTFRVIFDKPVSGLSVSNFSLGQTITDAEIINVSPLHGAASEEWDVTVNFSPTEGYLRLDLVNSEGASPSIAALPYTLGDYYAIIPGQAPQNAAPTATVASTPDISTSGETSYTVRITYADSDGTITGSSVGANNIAIEGLTYNDHNIVTGLDANSTVVDYFFTPPGGSWDFNDNATYTISLGTSPVTDDRARPVASLAGDTAFSVNIAPPDLTPPAVATILRMTPDAYYTNADVLVFEVAFTEAVSGVGVGDFTVTGGTTATVTGVTGGGDTYEVTVSGGDLANFNGAVGLVLEYPNGIQDAAGNGFSSTPAPISPLQNYIVDNVPPTIIIGAPSLTVTTGAQVTFGVSYSGSDSIALTEGDVVLIKTGNADGVAYTSGSGNDRTVGIHNISGVGTLSIFIKAGTAADNAGNLAPAAGPSATVNVTDGIRDFSGLSLTDGTPTVVNETFNIVFNQSPEAPELLLPVDYSSLDVSGHSLNSRPWLLWVVPADPDSDSLHFTVTVGASSFASADDQTGFFYRENGNWTPFPATGAPSSAAGAVAAYQPVVDLAPAIYSWRVQADDGTSTSAVSANRSFVIAQAAWYPIQGDGFRISKAFVEQLREEINRARNFRGLPDYIWLDSIAANQSLVRAAHVQEMRDAVEEALEATYEPIPEWNAIAPQQTLIRSSDFQQIGEALE